MSERENMVSELLFPSFQMWNKIKAWLASKDTRYVYIKFALHQHTTELITKLR